MFRSKSRAKASNCLFCEDRRVGTTDVYMLQTNRALLTDGVQSGVYLIKHLFPISCQNCLIFHKAIYQFTCRVEKFNQARKPVRQLDGSSRAASYPVRPGDEYTHSGDAAYQVWVFVGRCLDVDALRYRTARTRARRDAGDAY